MNNAMLDAKENELRVLILGPTAKDIAFCKKVFQNAGIECHACKDIPELCDEFEHGAGLMLITQEVFFKRDSSRLTKLLASQPPWSDIPLLLLVSSQLDSSQNPERLPPIERVTYIRLPVEVLALVSSVQSALRDRTRQYAARNLLKQREAQAEELRQADRRKDEFLATLAHELRNPLAPLRAGVDILLLDEEVAKDRDDTLNIMDRQLQQMVRLIDDLLDVSRITRDKLTLNLHRVELKGIIQNAIESTRQLIDNSGISLNVSMPHTPIFIFADPARLSQVFANLLNNAAKYTESGGHIELRAHIEAGKLHVEIKDTGIGIQPEMLVNIFEMFSQVDTSLNRSRGGLGIGLTLVKRLVELHGGEVSATSQGTGKGSQFTVKLPLATAEPNESDHNISTPRENLPRHRVLVVDDTPAARFMLSKLLEKLGQDVCVAENALQAIELFETTNPDIVISDIGMPDIDGYELARRLDKLPARHSARLIALTGYGQAQDATLALDAGFDQHLVKPVSMTTLRETLAIKK